MEFVDFFCVECAPGVKDANIFIHLNRYLFFLILSFIIIFKEVYNYSQSFRQRQSNPQQFSTKNNDYKNKLINSSGGTTSSIRLLLNSKHAENNIESAWERGLRQARELVKKKQNQSESFESNYESWDNINDLENGYLFLKQIILV